MAYEKKIEPLSRYEVFLAGFSLQVFLIFFCVLPWISWGKNDCGASILNGEVSSLDDVTDTHECMISHRSGMLGGATCLLLAYPFIIAHIFYTHRMFETVLAFLNMGLFEAFYIASWMISATIMCTVVPALGIFIAYYDWEFDEEFEYVGFAMQFQFLHLLLILRDCIVIPFGLAAATPWVFRMCAILGWAESKHYKLSEEMKVKLMGDRLGCKGCKKWFFVIISLLFTLIILFGSFAEVFDYDKVGFFSYHGGSQYLSATVLIAWEIQAILTMMMARHIDEHVRMLNENVKSMSEQDSITAGL